MAGQGREAWSGKGSGGNMLATLNGKAEAGGGGGTAEADGGGDVPTGGGQWVE